MEDAKSDSLSTYVVSATRRLAFTATLLAAAFLLLLTACGSEPTTLRDGGVTVLLNDSERGGQEAALDGEVTVENGCAGVDGRVIVWPSGTSIEGTAPFVLDVPGQGQVVVGEAVSLGGGSVAVDTAKPVVDGLIVPDECLGSADEVFAAN